MHGHAHTGPILAWCAMNLDGFCFPQVMKVRFARQSNSLVMFSVAVNATCNFKEWPTLLPDHPNSNATARVSDQWSMTNARWKWLVRSSYVRMLLDKLQCSPRLPHIPTKVCAQKSIAKWPLPHAHAHTHTHTHTHTHIVLSETQDDFQSAPVSLY